MKHMHEKHLPSKSSNKIYVYDLQRHTFFTPSPQNKKLNLGKVIVMSR